MITHKKEFGIYHWDTFDNTTILIDEADTLGEAKDKVKEKYGDRAQPKKADISEMLAGAETVQEAVDKFQEASKDIAAGADQVDIVDQEGDIVAKYSVG